MGVDRRVSPNQVALWTVYELRNGAGQRSAVVRLACYYGRSTGVNGGQSSHRPAQVRGGELGRPPIFQAGHAGSIPVTRSSCESAGQKAFSTVGHYPLVDRPAQQATGYGDRARDLVLMSCRLTSLPTAAMSQLRAEAHLALQASVRRTNFQSSD
jgi:hypothetical protein